MYTREQPRGYLHQLISPGGNRGRGYFNRGRGYSERMGDKTASRLAIDKFDSDTDNFTEWVGLFEDAVKLAHNVTLPADVNRLCLIWIKLWVDSSARAVLSQVVPADPAAPTWAETKAQLTTLLINPHEKYNWRAKKNTIMWDGKESFHSLATRIKQNVDKYDPDCAKEQEYFFRFRWALPPDFQKAIDLGCRDESEETIKEAKRIAYKFLDAKQRETGVPAASEKSVAFTGASMSDDRLKAMELSQQSILVELENLKARDKKKDDRRRDSSSSRERHESRNPHHRSQSRDGEGRRDRGNRGRNSRRDEHESRDGYRSFEGSRSPERYHRDSLDRRGGRRDVSDYRRESSGRRDSSRYRDGYSRDRYERRGNYYSREDSRRRDSSYGRSRDSSYQDRDSSYQGCDDTYRRERSYGRGDSFRRDTSRRRDDYRRRDGYGPRDSSRSSGYGRRDGRSSSRDDRRGDSRDSRDSRRGDRRGDRGDRRDGDRQSDRSSGDKPEHKLANFDLEGLGEQLGKLCSAMGLSKSEKD